MFEFFRAEYECNEIPGVVRSTLKERIGYPPTEQDNTWIWISEHQWGLYRNRLEYHPFEKSLTIRRRASQSIRYAIIMILGSLVFGIFASNTPILNLTAFVGLLLIALFYEISNVPAIEHASLQSYRFTLDYYIVIGVTLIAITVSPAFDTWFVAGAVVIAVLLVANHYARGATIPWMPFSSRPNRSPTQLKIVLLGCTLPIVLVLLLVSFVVVWVSFPGWVALSLSIGIGVLGTLYYGTACSWHLYQLSDPDLVPFPSRTARYSSLIVYVMLNVFLFQVIVFAGNFIAYSFTGMTIVSIHEPGAASTELVNLIRGEVGATIGIGGYIVDPITAGAVALPFLPVVVLVVYWLVFVYRGWASHVRIVNSSETYQWEAPDGTTVPVRLVDGIVPTAAVRGLIFGFRPYIVASRRIMDELEDDERDAVFTHELYHIRNHDLLVNTVATLSSVFVFGGRNAFLVFYDYPRIEREADEYAARMTDPETVISALETMQTVALKSRIRTGDATFGPRTILFSGRLNVNTSKTNRIRKSISRVFRRIVDWFAFAKRDLRAIYRLFYGDVIFDNAHESVDDRIARLEEFARDET